MGGGIWLLGEDEEAQADDEEEDDGFLLGFELLPVVSLFSIFKRVDGCLGVFPCLTSAVAVVPVAPVAPP